jgi:predicted HTH transcriptional regulator
VPEIHVKTFDGKKVICIIVQKAIDNTFHTFNGIVRVKIGSTLKKIEGNQLVDFLRTKQILCFDELSSETNVNDLDDNKIKEYLKIRKQQDYLKNNSVENFLLSQKLATRNGQFKIKNATVLFFTKEPAEFHPQIEIKLAQFEGMKQLKF